MIRGLTMAGLALLGLSCTGGDDVIYEQFNASGEELTVLVGDEVGELAELPLLSTTGSVEIGLASVSPDSGPVGTLHTVEVTIHESWAHMVDSVDLLVQSPERGEQEFTLEPDSAYEGLYRLELTSAGFEDESRTDTLTFFVLDIVGDADESDTSN